MADEVVASRLVTRLREAERLAAGGKVGEAKTILKEVVREAREKGLEKSLHNLISRVRAVIRHKTRR
ncbi:MAG: hypothetical protein ACK4SY_01540 [Pyrobaculum sp.]